MKLDLFLTILTIFNLGSAAWARGVLVDYPNPYPVGTLVIHTDAKVLYQVQSGQSALRYRVATPKAGKNWLGTAHVEGKHWMPAWAPPREVKKDNPDIPDYIPSGDPRNPMGVAALTLDRDQFAIHGVARGKESSIGTAASYGCIRLLNEDIRELFATVEIGTLVVMRSPRAR